MRQSRLNSSKMSPIKKFIFFKAFSIPFLLIGAYYLFLGILNILNAHAGTDWPLAQGQITKSEVSYNRTSNRGLYAHDFLYAFIVEGTVFTGNRISYGTRMSNMNSYAHDLAKRYPKDKIVTVYYNPNNPKECVLEPGITVWTWVKPIVGLIVFAIGIAMYIGLAKSIRN